MNKSSCFKLLAQYVPTCQIALYELYLLIYISIPVSLVVCHILFISYISLQIYLDYIFLWMLPWFLLLVRGRTQCIGRSAPSIFRLTVPVISPSLLLLLFYLFLFFYFLLSSKNQWLFKNSPTPLQIYIALLHTGRFSKNTAFFIANIFTSQGGLNRNSCSIFLSSCSGFSWYCISHCTYMLFMTESCAISMLWSGLVLHTTWSPP